MKRLLFLVLLFVVSLQAKAATLTIEITQGAGGRAADRGGALRLAR